jgi:uncharacterized protein YhdP
MRRWRWRLLVAAVLVAGLAAAALALRRLPPNAELAEAALSRMLGQRVEIDHFQLGVGAQLRFDIAGLRVYPAEAPAGAVPILDVPRALGHQSWARVLAGQIAPLAWRLERPLLPAIPELDLIVIDGRVEWQRPRGEMLSLRGLGVEARRGRLTRRTRGQAHGELFAGEVFLAALDVEFEGWLYEGALRGQVEALDLSWLPQDPVAVRGRANARFELRRRSGRTELDLQASVAGLRLDLPRLSQPLRPRIARVDALLGWHQPQLELELRQVKLDDVDLSGRVSIGPERVRADVQVAAFEPGPSARLHPLALLGYRMATWDRVNQRIAAGRVRDARVRCDVARGELGAVFGFDRRLEPGELEIALSVEGGTYRSDDGGPALEEISGQLQIRDNELHVAQLRMRRGEQVLPELDIRIDGMHQLAHLPRDERSAGPGPGVPLPGLEALIEELRGSPGQDGGELAVSFRDLELHHPMTRLPLRGASGLLRQSRDQLQIENAEGILGGVPARFDIRWDGAVDRIELAVRYRDDPAPPRVDRGEWLRAHVTLPRLRLGGWVVEQPSGWLTARAERLDLSELRGRLGGGDASGSGWIALGETGRAPYSFDLAVTGADASQIAPRLGLQPDNLSGQLEGSARIAGRMAPREPFLDSGQVEATLVVREGTLNGLPALMTIARLASLTGGLSTLLGRPVGFRSVQTQLAIEKGVLTMSDFELVGSEINALAQGQVKLRDPARPTDLLVTLLFARTLSKLLANLPLLETRNLVALSFHVTGSRDQLQARLVPPETLATATGWATGKLSGGLKRLWDLLPGMPGGKKSDAETDEPTPPPQPESAGPDPNAP